MATTRRERKHPKRGKVFFNEPLTLARLFTQPNRLNYAQQKWFDNRGLKAIEAFESDIKRNLIEWGYSGDSLYYRTERFWYDYTVTNVDGTRIIECTRYCNNRWTRWDTWMNLHSTSVGKNHQQGKEKSEAFSLRYHCLSNYSPMEY
jgi:hypothetical protein